MPRIQIEGIAPNIDPETGMPVDGRQSQSALTIRRGVCRRLRSEGLALIAEVTLASGRRADLVALAPSGEITIIEIKSSVEDFRVDAKWPDYRRHADRLYFATAPHVPVEIFPLSAGLIVADAFSAEVLREAPLEKIAAATRKEMLIRLARAGAHRLHDLEDPPAGGKPAISDPAGGKPAISNPPGGSRQ